MGSLSPKAKWILGVILLSSLIIGGSFLYTKVVKKPGSSIPLPSLQKTSEGQIGLQAAQKLLDEYPQFVKRAFIQQQIEGTLKTTIGNNWILEAGGKSMTLTNQGTNKIRYTKIPKIATSSSKVTAPSEIKLEEIKTGDLLLIDQLIDWKTGKVTILGITVLSPK